MNGENREMKAANDSKRKQIIENDYLFYMKFMPESERNKKIITEYANGKSFVELGAEYGLSSARVSAIVANYIRHVKMFLNGYKKW